jgi:ferredoxin
MTEISQARDAAMSVLEGYELTPTSLIAYQSNGRVAIIGDSASLSLCAPWSDNLDIALITTEDEIEVQGHLGAFIVTRVDSHGNTQTLTADILLDLNVVPINKMQMLPPGYIHALIDDENALDVKAQVSGWVGEFDKPKYFNYDASICAHSVNGKTVCTNCIDACPAGAIQSLADWIQVDPYLCQGGGVCSAVCPSGAIQYAYPQPADSGNQVRKMLEVFQRNDGVNAVMVFHAEEEFPQSVLAHNDSILPFRVEELASVGPELCLSALVYGVAQVVLLPGETIPDVSLAQLKQQVKWLQVLLGGFGMPTNTISLCKPDELLNSVVTETSITPANYTMPNSKRQALFQAIDHLYQQVDQSVEVVELPTGAPFGTAIIDESLCTLCMACVGACPGKALQDGSNREIPEVFFIESKCLQCGACVQTCPEEAISIYPRLVLDRESRNKSRVLNQDVPFACIGCGKPFAPTSVIHKMQDRLKDHYMFGSSRALDRLKMCEDCRVADIVQDPEAMKGNFDPSN